MRLLVLTLTLLSLAFAPAPFPKRERETATQKATRACAARLCDLGVSWDLKRLDGALWLTWSFRRRGLLSGGGAYVHDGDVLETLHRLADSVGRQHPGPPE